MGVGWGVMEENKSINLSLNKFYIIFQQHTMVAVGLGTLFFDYT